MLPRITVVRKVSLKMANFQATRTELVPLPANVVATPSQCVVVVAIKLQRSLDVVEGPYTRQINRY